MSGTDDQYFWLTKQQHKQVIRLLNVVKLLRINKVEEEQEDLYHTPFHYDIFDKYN